MSPEYEDDEEAALQEEIRKEIAQQLRHSVLDEEDEIEQQLNIKPHA